MTARILSLWQEESCLCDRAVILPVNKLIPL